MADPQLGLSHAPAVFGAAQLVLVLHADEALLDGARLTLSAQTLMMFAWWQASARAGALDALAFEEDVVALVQELAGHTQGRTQATHAAVERARCLLNADPGSAANLAEIAAAACSSPFHLAREFRRHTGTSLHAYRTRLHMALPLDRIAQGERNFSALAAELG